MKWQSMFGAAVEPLCVQNITQNGSHAGDIPSYHGNMTTPTQHAMAS